jgi:hypothetical protein
MTNRLGSAALLALLAAGCGSDLEWVRPGQSAEANQRDHAACERTADDRYKQPLTPEITQGYGGDVPSPARGAYPSPLAREVPDLPLRTGRGDIVNNEDAAIRLDREMGRSAAIANRGQSLRDCLAAAGFALRPATRP